MPIILLLALSILSSCGKSSTFSTRHLGPDNFQEAPMIEGSYKASLTPINSAVGGFGRGEVVIQVIADNINVKVQLDDGTPLVDHQQFVYSGKECPGESVDTNDDGLVDPLEAAPFLGQQLFGLDSQIDSSQEDILVFPRSDALGAFQYYQEGKFSELLAHFGPLELEGKVVAIHGIHQETYLPGSVRTHFAGLERESILIACGVLQRVKLEDTQTSGPENP